MTVKSRFEETIEVLMNKHKTSLGGTEAWINWDAIYTDLLDEGYDSSEASLLLDEYMELKGY